MDTHFFSSLVFLFFFSFSFFLFLFVFDNEQHTVRSMFGKNARTDPQWISELTYYVLYDFIGRGLPAVILLILMRNPDQAYGRSNDDNSDHPRSNGSESGRDGGSGAGRGIDSGSGRGGRGGGSGGGGSSPRLWSSGEDQGHYLDWPSESSHRSQYDGGYNGSHLHNQSLGSDEFVE